LACVFLAVRRCFCEDGAVFHATFIFIGLVTAFLVCEPGARRRIKEGGGEFHWGGTYGRVYGRIHFLCVRLLLILMLLLRCIFRVNLLFLDLVFFLVWRPPRAPMPNS